MDMAEFQELVWRACLARCSTCWPGHCGCCGCAKIDLLHLRVVGDCLRCAFGKEFAEIQHQDALGDIEHNAENVLDEQNGVPRFFQLHEQMLEDFCFACQQAGG